MRAAPVASVRRAMSTAQRRHQIVESAAMLFDAQGYGNTSMEDVALAVSIAKPTLYHYFRSKEEILRSIHEEFIQLLTEKYVQRVSTGAEPEELALGAMKDILSLMVTHRGYVRVFFEHHRELPPDAKRYVTAQRDAYESLVQSAIGAGQAHPDHLLAAKQMPGGFGGVVSVELEGGADRLAVRADGSEREGPRSRRPVGD